MAKSRLIISSRRRRKLRIMSRLEARARTRSYLLLLANRNNSAEKKITKLKSSSNLKLEARALRRLQNLTRTP
jgi:hypothetical protein